MIAAILVFGAFGLAAMAITAAAWAEWTAEWKGRVLRTISEPGTEGTAPQIHAAMLAVGRDPPPLGLLTGYLRELAADGVLEVRAGPPLPSRGGRPRFIYRLAKKEVAP